MHELAWILLKHFQLKFTRKQPQPYANEYIVRDRQGFPLQLTRA